MTSIAIELTVIILLLVANGVFAMAEIAIIAARKGRLRQLTDTGDARAKVALALAESPNNFLATVQIGITLVGILAGAFGGATIAEKLGEVLHGVPVLGSYGNAVGLGVVVLGITYFSLVLGELVPKRIGLGNPEGIAMTIARPMNALSVFAGPVVKFLSVSTDKLLGLLGVKPEKEAAVNEDEIKVLMQEGLRAGSFQKVESDIIQSVLDLDQITVRDIMTPRPKIIWLNRDDSHETVWHKIVVSAHSSFPVYQDTRDNVVGIVTVKAIYANLAAGAGVKLSDLMAPPLVVPATQNVLQLVETFKKSGKHLALVADEFGNIVGLVTLNDLMEAILGDFISQDERAKPTISQRPDGSWLIDAMIDIDRVARALDGFQIADAVSKDYQTLAGFVVKQLGHLPKEGETFETQNYLFEIIDMDRHRVDKVLVMRLKPQNPTEEK